MKTPVLYIVVPCYNEEQVLTETATRLFDKLRGLIADNTVSVDSRILFVDDGSKDKTWEMIHHFHQTNEWISGLKLSRNRGHQNALFAGLMYSKEHCDCSISIDADLQDDIDVIDGFLEGYQKGCDVVYGVRNDRQTDSGFKRGTANIFYKMMAKLGVESVQNHADCRLLSRRVMEAMSNYGENSLYLRGIVPQLGFTQGVVTYKRDKRFAGESKYSFKKMVELALNGITSFSVEPLHMILYAGIFICVAAVISYIIYLIRVFTHGYPSAPILTTIWFVGGLQLGAIGVVGEYIGHINLEVKRRPRYIVEVVLDHSPDAELIEAPQKTTLWKLDLGNDHA